MKPFEEEGGRWRSPSAEGRELSAELSPEAPAAVLDRVREYRRAARKIVGADWVDVARRCAGLLELADAVRSEPDLIVRHWAEGAIWEESKAFLGMADEEQPLPPESYEHRQRRLRLMGEDRCGRCHSVIASEAELARWARLRRDAADRRRVCEEAIK